MPKTNDYTTALSQTHAHTQKLRQTCTHTHIRTLYPGGKVTNFKRLDTYSHFHHLPRSQFPLLSIACSLLLPHLSNHREKFIHNEESNHLQVWREDPALVTLCDCEKWSTIAFQSQKSTVTQTGTFKFRYYIQILTGVLSIRPCVDYGCKFLNAEANLYIQSVYK